MDQKMTENEWLEIVTRDTARTLLFLAKKTWPGMNPEVMARGVLIEEVKNVSYSDITTIVSLPKYGDEDYSIDIIDDDFWRTITRDKTPIEDDKDS